MKTPYRQYTLYESGINPENGDIIMGEFAPLLHDARWKRKNRIAQLKRSLHRYKHGTMLDGQYDLYLAYRWLQRLSKPNEGADSASWENYRYQLRAIRGVIVAALQESEEAWKKAREREYRKEQDND